MASGNESPRQKMINLMYLVFIAMLALNMSKEVLSAFGVINEEVTLKIESTRERSQIFLAELKAKAQNAETGLQYKDVYTLVDSLYNMGMKLDRHIASIKPNVKLKSDKFDFDNNSLTDSIGDYEKMDGTKDVDELFFDGKGYTAKGQEFVDAINDFRNNSLSYLSSKDQELRDNNKEPLYESIIKSIDEKFNTDEKNMARGKTQSWLHYNYEGFPLITSVTKMSLIQDDVQKVLFNILTLANNNKLLETSGTNTLRAVVIPGYYNDENRWVSTSGTVFKGENFSGKVILAKYDSTLAPNYIKLPNYFEGSGSEAIADNKLKGGEVILDIASNSVGPQNLSGELLFELQKGLTTSVDTIGVDFNYNVTEKPTSASIANVKMNVVYEALPNELQIGIPTIRDEDLIVTANGKILKKRVDKQKGLLYTLNAPKPTKGKKDLVTIKVSVKESETSSNIGPFFKDFRIKKLGNPEVIFNNSTEKFQWNRSALRSRFVDHKYADSDIDLPLRVVSFDVSVSGKRPISINGNKINDNSAARTALLNARRGDYVIIQNVRSVGVNNPSFSRTTKKPLTLRIQD
jgi:gliding motility-associated protein GldM